MMTSIDEQEICLAAFQRLRDGVMASRRPAVGPYEHHASAGRGAAKRVVRVAHLGSNRHIYDDEEGIR
jgi:hypothetical protein